MIILYDIFYILCKKKKYLLNFALLFFFKFQWTAAHMEAEEHFSKRESPSVPTGAEDPRLYGQRSRNTLNFGLTLLGDIYAV